MKRPLRRIRWLGTLRGRLLAGLGVLLLSIAGGTAVGVTAFRLISSDFAESLRSTEERGAATAGLEAAVLEMIVAGQAYLSGSGGQQIAGSATGGAAAARFSDAAQAAHTELRHLRQLRDLTDEDRIMVGRLADWQAEVEVQFALAHAWFDLGGVDSSRAAAARAGRSVDSVSSSVRHLSLRQAAHAEQLRERLGATARSRQLQLVLVTVVSILIGTVIALLTIRGVQAPMARLREAAARIGSGDLGAVETGEMLAEMAAVGAAFSGMGERLRSIIGEVAREADRIGSSAGDLSAVSEQIAASSGEITNAMMEVSRGAETQAARLAETREGLAELIAQSDDVQGAAARAANLGTTIREVAGQHQNDVRNTVVALLAVQETVTNSAAQVRSLATTAESIDEFVRLVKGIARQTNLLAVNAAIEAVQAGEHGRGFAVVAKEVRKLADSSSSSAEKVASALRSIRDQVARVTATMEGGVAKVRDVESVSKAMETGLERILTSVAGIEDAARVVQAAAERNRTAAVEMSKGVADAAEQAGKHAGSAQSVTAAAEEESASTQEMAAAAGELLRAAERLREVVSGFRV